MKKMISKMVAGLLIASMVLLPSPIAKADSTEMKSMISFGANLSASEKQTVMSLLGVTESDLSNYEVITVTNQDEHSYLDDYVSSKMIGTRALSSVKVEKAEEGSGIGVETHNITYCTSGMYSNALITAGVEDADVVVAGPFNISGTAALVGAMKAYSAMTGQEIDASSADAATNELVVTGELGESVGADKATQFMALIKQKIVDEGYTSAEDIGKAVDEAADSMDIEVSADKKEKIVSVMEKISDLDIDVDSLKNQAEDIYNKIKDYGIDEETVKGIWDHICDFFSGIVDYIAGLF